MVKGLQRSLSRGPGVNALSQVKRLNIPLRDLSVTVTSVAAAIGFGSAVIRGLPEGLIQYLGASMEIVLAGNGADANLSDTWAGDCGVGTTPAADATISGADVDILASTALAAATAEASPLTPLVSTATEAPATFDNTAGDLELNLNVLIDAADIVDDQSVILLANGVLQIAYIDLGDN